jgi:hypothetical protein
MNIITFIQRFIFAAFVAVIDHTFVKNWQVF